MFHIEKIERELLVYKRIIGLHKKKPKKERVLLKKKKCKIYRKSKINKKKSRSGSYLK